MDWHHGTYGFPQEPTVHYFNGTPGQEDNGQEEGEPAPRLDQNANGNTNLYETLIASQPHSGLSKIPGLHTTTPKSADKKATLEKAAMLREKLLASRRTSSRDATPADNAKNLPSQAGKSRASGLEELIREGREAAEKSSKQHGPFDGTQINALEQHFDLTSPAKPAHHAHRHEHANGDTNVTPAAKTITSPMSNAREKPLGTIDHAQSKNDQDIIDKRAIIAAHQNDGNDNHGAAPTIQTNRAGALRDKPQSKVDDATHWAEEANESVQLRPFNKLDGPLTNVSNDDISAAGLNHSILSKYFSDLNEWLEITGYHDLPLRQRTLTRHRRRLQLEQELAQLDQEDEEDRNVASRSGTIALLPPAESSSAMRPVGLTSGTSAHPSRTTRTDISTAIADASAAASLPSTPAVDEAHIRAKRPNSASSDVHRPQKQQRTEVNETISTGKSFNRQSFRAPENVTNSRPPYSYSNRAQDSEHRRSSHENHYRLRHDSEYDRPTHKPSSHTWHARASTADPFSRDRYSEVDRTDVRAGEGDSFGSQRRFKFPPIQQTQIACLLISLGSLSSNNPTPLVARIAVRRPLSLRTGFEKISSEDFGWCELTGESSNLPNS